jgi:AraC-like DNA-binding protein
MEPRFEAIELEGDSCFRLLRFQCDNFAQDHSWHYHPEIELTFILQGEGTRFVGDSVFRYRANDLVMVGPNLPHCWTNEAESTSGPNDLIVLQFSPDCLGQDFLNIADAQPLRRLIEASARGLHFQEAASATYREDLLSLLELEGLARLVAFIELLAELAGDQAVQSLTSDFYRINNAEFNGGRMTKVMTYVREHLRDEIRQTEVADIVAMTPQGFSRFFRATTGRTFVSFVNALRVMEAARLLVNTDDDIIDIAFACGYANLSNFNRRFLEIKQTTPREYRKLHAGFSE